MKLTCQTSLLLETLAVSTRAITSKASMPVLECVLIRADKDKKRIFITGNSLDVSITASCEASIEESGAMCIAGRRFQNIVAALAGETVAITALRHAINVHCGPSRYRFMTIPPEEFPATPVVADGQTMTFAQKRLAEAIASVEPAQSEDATRFILNGTLLQRDEKGSLYFVATDGRRMHANTSEGGVESVPAGIIIPIGSVQRVLSMLAETGDVEVTFNDRFARFVFKSTEGETELTTKLVEGNFPAWKNVIGGISGDVMKIKQVDMVAAIRRSLLALSEKTLAVRLSFSESAVEIKSDSADFGESTETVACENPKKLAASVWLNATFLLEAVESVRTDDVLIHIRPEKPDTSPVGVTDGAAVRAIIMPVKR
jgi:DNA polymerase-3 subunit beta